jgi:predicted nucleic acid-binding Zn ribbon protein
MDSDNQDYFDFKTIDELPEEYSKQERNCPHCGKPIPADSLFCLYCGEPILSSKKNKWVVLVVIFLLVAFILLMLVR